MKPGIERAVPAGILGFLIGAGIVVVLRALQGLEPVWYPEIAAILGFFMAAGAFIWGVGASDPRTNQHPHGPEVDEYGVLVIHDDDHDDHEEETDDRPGRIMGISIWQVAFWVTMLMIVVFGMATIQGGFGLTISNDPSADRGRFGYQTIELPFGGPEMEVTQLMVFVGFAVFTFASLAVAGGAIGGVMYFLSRGATTAKEVDALPLERSLSGAVTQKQVTRPWPLIGAFVAVFVVVFALLAEWLLPEIVDWPHYVTAPIALFVALGAVAALFVPLFRARGAEDSLREMAVFLGVAIFLYWLFFYILIGFVIASGSGFGLWVRIALSAVNAVLVAAILAYPTVVARITGRLAGGLAHWLRRVPAFLGSR